MFKTRNQITAAQLRIQVQPNINSAQVKLHSIFLRSLWWPSVHTGARISISFENFGAFNFTVPSTSKVSNNKKFVITQLLVVHTATSAVSVLHGSTQETAINDLD